MADKTIGELKRATSLDNDSLMIAEQQGEAVSVTGGLFKSFAQESTKGFAESASADAATAVDAKNAAQSALKGVQDALNNLPAGGTVVINDLTTGGTTAALSAEMGKQLKQELATKTNPHLLHNWYFANPVNQRGQTEYTAPSAIIHTIDRWWMGYVGTVTLGSDGLTITNPASGGTIDFGQTMEFGDFLPGRTVTISVMIGGEVSGEDIEIPSEPTLNSIVGSLVLDWGEVCLIYDVNGMFRVVFRLNPLATVANVQAVKMELGSTQTLAHQDENGNWVLNEIPSYGEELLKCQRYFEVGRVGGVSTMGMGATYITGSQFRVEKRERPQITICGVDVATDSFGQANKVNHASSGWYSEANVESVYPTKHGFDWVRMDAAVPTADSYTYFYFASADL